MVWRVSIDTGGTFTDVVALNDETGERHVLKVNSTPKDPSIALTNGVQEISDKLGIKLSEIADIMHGTTAATNAILEGAYPPLGLIVTKGFRDILEIRRQDVPGDFGDVTWWIKPDRVVPLDKVREVGGRLNYQGKEVSPLNEDEVREAALEFRDLGISALAVSLIHSYIDPSHELRCREIIKEVHPDCFVSLSSDIIREYREYERTQGTCLNTALMPLMSSYIGRIEERLAQIGCTSKIYIMKSSGGLTSATELAWRPLNSVLSGPAAGVMAAAHNGPAAGFNDLLTLDVGGTSADIALIEGKMPRVLNAGRIEDHDIKVPMIDMTTVGAGGGSIAWIADNGALRVGPDSAGSQPGPVCYGRGGKRPTVTDAHLVLGRISEELLGGDVKLDIEAARKAIIEQIAEPLGLTLERAASGILELAIQNMVTGIRTVSVSRGRDPRQFALLPFGGGGSMHACLVADELGIRNVFIPTAPGAMSAEGLLLSDVRVDRAITLVRREQNIDAKEIADEIVKLEADCRADLAEQNFGADRTRTEANAELRYVGQAYEIRVPVNTDADPDALVQDLIRTFHTAHADRFGFSYEGEHEVEIVNLSFAAFGALSASGASGQPKNTSGKTWDDYKNYSRQMYHNQTGQKIKCDVFKRPFGELPGQVSGPCVIEQYDTTIVVDPGWNARSLADGNIVIERV